jgi:hypothetical protein
VQNWDVLNYKINISFTGLDTNIAYTSQKVSVWTLTKVLLRRIQVEITTIEIFRILIPV